LGQGAGSGKRDSRIIVKKGHISAKNAGIKKNAGTSSLTLMAGNKLFIRALFLIFILVAAPGAFANESDIQLPS